MTTRISVELVPRNLDSLAKEAREVAEQVPWIDTINVPDLIKFDVRSWRGCAHVGEVARRADGSRFSLIPHVRAADCDPDAPLPMVEALREAGITEVLVVSGDDADYFTHHTYPVDAVDVIRRFRTEAPDLTVYAGLDPYRQGMALELRYLERKLSAGATGIFTQPFFDASHLRAWAAILPSELPVWWGATTVTSPASLGYWRRRNRVAFPTGFEPTLEWHRGFAQEAVDLAVELGHHVYLMPVRTSPTAYLAGLRGPTLS